MGLPTPPFNPNTPIPNNPFSSPQSYYVAGLSGPTIIGDGLYIDYETLSINSSGSLITGIIAGLGISVSSTVGNVTVSNTGVLSLTAGPGVSISGSTGNIVISTSGAPGTGTVTSVGTGTGLTGGTITTSGTISLANTAVTPGSYTNANITVDAQGRLTAASSGSAGSGTVTSITAGTGLTGGTITTSGTVALANTAVTPGSYTFSSFTVDAQGRLTAASNGTLPVATPTSAGIVLGCTATRAFGLFGITALGCCAYFCGGSFGVNTSTAIGFHAMRLSDGTDNVAVGSFALEKPNQLGSENVALGAYALCGGGGGLNNVAVGYCAGSAITTGSCNLVLGNCAQVASATGNAQLAIGYSATDNWLTGNSTKAIKPGAGIIDKNNSCGTAGQVLMSDGSNAICWGSAGGSVPSATPTVEGVVLGCTDAINAALGCNALLANTTGSNNVATGISALAGNTSGINNTALGWYALSLTTTTSDNTAVGGQAGSGAIGDENTFIGRESGSGVTGSGNTFLGWAAGKDQLTGDYNLALGYAVDVANLNGSCQLAIGFSATDNWLTGDSTKAIKPGAGIIDCTGSCGTAGQALLSNGANAVCWGAATAAEATPTTLGTLKGCTYRCSVGPTPAAGCYVALGCDAAVARTTGSLNVAIGDGALCSATSASLNIAIGNCALKSMVSINSNVAIGFTSMCFATAGALNTAVGNQTMTGEIGNSNTAVGERAMRSATGSTSVAVGNCALRLNSGTQNVALGNLAGNINTTGSSNTFVGFSAGSTIDTGCCNLFLGAYADLAADVSCCLYIGIGGGSPLPWLTGESTGAIKPGAGIIDCANVCGGANQVLVSTGANAVQWKSVNSAIAAPNYANYIATNPQIATVVNTPQPVIFNIAAGENNFLLSGTGDQIIVGESGLYNFQFSAQILSTGGGGGDVEIWPVLNGADIPESNTRFSVKNSNEAECAALNYVIPLAAGDTLALYWGTTSLNVELAAVPSVMTGPGIPSVIATVVPVGA